jgi:hypothetical protein
MATRIDEGDRLARKGACCQPGLAEPSRLACAYALEDKRERAATELDEARQLSADDRYLSIARLTAANSWAPKARALLETTYFAGLRKAGVPEK